MRVLESNPVECHVGGRHAVATEAARESHLLIVMPGKLYYCTYSSLSKDDIQYVCVTLHDEFKAQRVTILPYEVPT